MSPFTYQCKLYTYRNYDAELFAFAKRLNENFQSDTLKRAFVHRSFVEQEAEKRAEFVKDESASALLKLEDNRELILKGHEIANSYCLAYLRHSLPNFPEEGLRAVVEHLTAVDNLAHLASNLGMMDLVQAGEFPFDKQTQSETFKAIVGALAYDVGLNQAEKFVQDFVLTQLIDMDVNDIWYPLDPAGVLRTILNKRGDPEPEPRILRQTGLATVTPVYIVGLFINQQLIGEAAGETVVIAEEMAARNALQRIFGTTEDRMLFRFGSDGHQLDVSAEKKRENFRLNELFDEEIATAPTSSNPDVTFQETELNKEEMLMKFKKEIEEPLGVPLRRRLMHKFYFGTKNRKNMRKINRPKVESL